jgi:hypothetical protein
LQLNITSKGEKMSSIDLLATSFNAPVTFFMGEFAAQKRIGEEFQKGVDEYLNKMYPVKPASLFKKSTIPPEHNMAPTKLMAAMKYIPIADDKIAREIRDKISQQYNTEKANAEGTSEEILGRLADCIAEDAALFARNPSYRGQPYKPREINLWLQPYGNNDRQLQVDVYHGLEGKGAGHKHIIFRVGEDKYLFVRHYKD